ncbi:hypothetical protein BFP72_12585 [Reichenbachiella sp. 5M10]|uniref:beta-ketoacyl synthase chain length factor n=1 Tax=Reichenbachiella sp. 5M10 TaxID=1889772 RepID=UPI000C15A2F0|nr:beta-ketoacyl synthase chain length factor [Reichenbachiella sp. 5M10]PIB36172.1 hypothetical protein BFP72_12585 [Reichenbachiella sp. 5M10]
MKKVFVKSAVSISCLDGFLGENLNDQLSEGVIERSLIEPSYREYITPAMIRRASKLMKMSLASSQAAMTKANLEKTSSIIVGSGLGCLADTEKFLKTSILAEEDSLIPPTAFIQSGHNAVSGQIALLHKNQSYNMTHIQKGLSFEYALMDAKLRLHEGDTSVLLGAVDEKIDTVEELADRMLWPKEIKSQLSEGCSFFVLTEEKTDVEIVSVRMVDTGELESQYRAVLEEYGLHESVAIERYVGYNETLNQELSWSHVVYTDVVGRYFSSSALGFHLAYDALRAQASVGDYAAVINVSDREFSSIMILRRV